jgi:hypothetical protein
MIKEIVYKQVMNIGVLKRPTQTTRCCVLVVKNHKIITI